MTLNSIGNQHDEACFFSRSASQVSALLFTSSSFSFSFPYFAFAGSPLIPTRELFVGFFDSKVSQGNVFWCFEALPCENVCNAGGPAVSLRPPSVFFERRRIYWV